MNSHHEDCEAKLTIGFDQDVVDGAPAARFAQQLVELIEDGCGLDR
ncbi:MAG: 2-oxo acid dehydrogenase subunit E2 [Chloroflexi bacterium]|nr:2-oxo acid dehydrogenase subunit E2 [Chloroflexota bacterium]